MTWFQPSCENDLALVVSTSWVALAPVTTTTRAPGDPIHQTGPRRSERARR